ncbi:MAG: gephyrin-like molybdotransferase Glp, partial [Limisphaerales bacterium]
MLELEEALKRILPLIKPLETEMISLSNALGRYAAQPVATSVDLPPFDNSAMDGYAVVAADLAEATADHPVPLHLIGKIAAGERFSEKLSSGHCVRIFTGSPLPNGADAVVMQEDTRVETSEPSRIWILDSVKPWENVRFRGEDIKQGATLVKPGEKLTGCRCALLAASGITNLSVRRKPVVGVLATGSELVEPGNTLQPGQIFESNRLGLATFIQQSGGIPKVYPLVEDRLESTVAALQQAFAECDAVVTSGGVSVGEFDFVKSAFEQLGGALSFWKVAVKPGKPFVFGQLGSKYLFGLPGNPVSALVTYFLLARPALLAMQGAAHLEPVFHSATLSQSIQNRGDRRHFIRVMVDSNGVA